MPNERDLILGKYNINEWRFRELKAFCRQYPEKKAQAEAMLGIQGVNRITEYHNRRGTLEGTVLPTGKGATGDPVARAAERREQLLQDVEIVDWCASQVEGGKWYKAIILSVCYGSSYETLDPSLLPTSHRSAFFSARRKFFCLLDTEYSGRGEKRLLARV